MDKINELLTRGVANIIPGKEKLEEVLKSGRKLNIYIGIDPTSPQIHLGHAVPLRKLQQFCELGHNVTFLIGDFTALIGDTSDKDTERPVLTSRQIEQNFQTYKKQAEKILNFDRVNVRYNSEWLKELNFSKIIKLTQHFSLGDFIGRELIKRRLDEKKRVGLHEVLYPVIQGYDSYFLDTDIQIGGTDQTFNMQAGRTLQKDLRNKESFVMATEFLEGTEGRKMSKTWGNAIWLSDTPNDIYAKVMAIKDDLIMQYYTLGTNVNLDKIAKIKKELDLEKNPMLVKKGLAYEITTELYDKKQADEAEQNFEKIVQRKESPANIPVYLYEGNEKENISNLLTTMQLAQSRGEAKRLVEQGGVEINDKRIANPNEEIKIENGMIIRVGKRRFVKIEVK